MGIGLLTLSLAIFVVSIRVVAHGERLRANYREDTEAVLVPELHRTYTEFVLEGAKGIVELGGLDPQLEGLRTEISARIEAGEGVGDLAPRYREAFERVELTVGLDRRMRNSMGESGNRILQYEKLRKTFEDAWKRKIEEGESYPRLALLVAGIGGLLLLVDFMSPLDQYGIIPSIALFGGAVLLMVAGSSLSTTYELYKETKQAQRKVRDRISSQRHGIPGLEESPGQGGER